MCVVGFLIYHLYSVCSGHLVCFRDTRALHMISLGWLLKHCSDVTYGVCESTLPFWDFLESRTEAELKFKSKSLSNLHLSVYLGLRFKSRAYQNAV